METGEMSNLTLTDESEQPSEPGADGQAHGQKYRYVWVCRLLHSGPHAFSGCGCGSLRWGGPQLALH